MSANWPCVPIDATWANRILEPRVNYLYRGYVIHAEDNSYTAYDQEGDEYGWGCTVYDILCVVNELVEGTPRRENRR